MSGVQVAADLRAAADVLRRDGWTQGVFRDPDTGCRCADGAIQFAVHNDAHRYIKASSAVMDRLRRGLIDWNDAPGRTADEVIAALEAAADAAEASDA